MSYKPHRIPGLNFNVKTGLYEITEERITYSFDFSMLAHLKNYLSERNRSIGIVGEWYADMSKFDKKKVKRVES